MPSSQRATERQSKRTTSLRRPAAPSLLLALGGSFYLALLAAITLGNVLGTERWWWSTLNEYLPQWLWAVPAPLLFLLGLRTSRRWCGISLLALLWVAGPLMGFCWRCPRSVGVWGRSPRLRVMTYNTEWWNHYDLFAVLAAIFKAQPDVVLLQDAQSDLATALAGELKGWSVAGDGQYIMASRFPLTGVELHRYEIPGPTHTYQHGTLLLNGIRVSVYNVHLVTPRDGLSAVRYVGLEGIGALQSNARMREQQAGSVSLRVWGERGPVVLGGDLNSPVQSLACRQLMAAGLFDAFSQAGWGYGYTYGHSLRVGHSYVRAARPHPGQPPLAGGALLDRRQPGVGPPPGDRGSGAGRQQGPAPPRLPREMTRR